MIAPHAVSRMRWYSSVYLQLPKAALTSVNCLVSGRSEAQPTAVTAGGVLCPRGASHDPCKKPSRREGGSKAAARQRRTSP